MLWLRAYTVVVVMEKRSDGCFSFVVFNFEERLERERHVGASSDCGNC